MTADPPQYTELARLKGIAHPLRAELYYRLAAAKESTATRLSEQLSATPSLVSYHLRQLAKYGFVEPSAPSNPDAPDGRDRWWRVIEGGFTFPSPTETEGADRVLLEQLEAVMYENQLRRIERFRQARDEWGVEWSSAAFSADFFLRLDPEQLRELYRELERVVRRFETRSPQPTEHGTGAETVAVLLHGFPV